MEPRDVRWSIAGGANKEMRMKIEMKLIARRPGVSRYRPKTNFLSNITLLPLLVGVIEKGGERAETAGFRL